MITVSFVKQINLVNANLENRHHSKLGRDNSYAIYDQILPKT